MHHFCFVNVCQMVCQNQAYWPVNLNCVCLGRVLAEVTVERSGDQRQAVSRTPAGESADDLEGKKEAGEKADRQEVVSETKLLEYKFSGGRRRWSENMASRKMCIYL